MSTQETVAMGLSARPAIYSMLQALFGREPQAEVVAALASPEFLQVTSLFFGEELGAAAGADGADAEEAAESLELRVAALQAVARTGVEGGDDSLDALDSAYARLFVGPRRPEAAPWESAYVGDDGLLFQPSTLEVRKAYVAQGLIPSRYPRIADDHLAIELGFLASLGQRASDAYDSNDADGLARAVAASREFLDDHLRPWLPAFCEALGQSSYGALYHEAAQALEAFTQADAAFLEAASLS